MGPQHTHTIGGHTITTTDTNHLYTLRQAVRTHGNITDHTEEHKPLNTLTGLNAHIHTYTHQDGHQTRIPKLSY